MAITDILLRQSAHPPLVTKGAELTFAEGDTNWIELYEAIVDLMSGSGVAPYNPLTAYSGTMYVSYAGNIWVHIAGTPSTGVTPGTNPLIWQLTSVGALIHQQNTDTMLAMGTATQVTAAELWSIINEQVITTTPVAFEALAAAGTLKPNRLYYFAATTKHLIRTLSPSSYSSNAHVLKSIPDYVTYTNQYDFVGVYSIGDYVTWDGLVFRNVTGSNPGTAPGADPTNWLVMTPFAVPYYKSKVFGCRIHISAGSVTDYEYTDEGGNTVSGQNNYALALRPAYCWGNDTDINSNAVTDNYKGSLYKNKLTSSILYIYQELATTGLFISNVLHKATVTLGSILSSNKNLGAVQNCHFENVSLVCVAGMDAGFLLDNLSIKMAPGDVINVSDNIVLADGYLTREGGNLRLSVGVTSGTEIDVGSFDIPDIYGIYEIDAAAGNPVATMVNANPVQKIKITPKPGGGNIDIQTKTFSAPVAVDEFMYDGATLTLRDASEDYIIVQRQYYAGFGYSVWRVVDTQIAP